jgi:hypothetical protein
MLQNDPISASLMMCEKCQILVPSPMEQPESAKEEA